jgi:hypothetical protein
MTDIVERLRFDLASSSVTLREVAAEVERLRQRLAEAEAMLDRAAPMIASHTLNVRSQRALNWLTNYRAAVARREPS